MSVPGRAEPARVREPAYGSTALSTAVETLVKIPRSDDPTSCNEIMAATETRAAIRPYSIAVAPWSSITKSLRRLVILYLQMRPWTMVTEGDDRFIDRIYSKINNLVHFWTNTAQIRPVRPEARPAAGVALGVVRDLGRAPFLSPISPGSPAPA